MENVIVKITDLVKRYDELTALDHFSLEIKEGEKTGENRYSFIPLNVKKANKTYDFVRRVLKIEDPEKINKFLEIIKYAIFINFILYGFIGIQHTSNIKSVNVCYARII